MNKRLNEKGSTSFFVMFVFLSIILLILFAVVIPVLQTMNIMFYENAEGILEKGKASAAQINDANVRGALESGLDAQTDSILTQIDILGVFFQYGWIIIILVITLVIFMITRQTVELQIK